MLPQRVNTRRQRNRYIHPYNPTLATHFSRWNQRRTRLCLSGPSTHHALRRRAARVPLGTSAVPLSEHRAAATIAPSVATATNGLPRWAAASAASDGQAAAPHHPVCAEITTELVGAAR